MTVIVIFRISPLVEVRDIIGEIVHAKKQSAVNLIPIPIPIMSHLLSVTIITLVQQLLQHGFLLLLL